MTKKMQGILVAVGIVVLGLLGFSGYSIWFMNQRIESYKSELTKLADVEKLETELKEANEKVVKAEKATKKAKAEVEDAKVELKLTKEKVDFQTTLAQKATKELRELKNSGVIEAVATPAATSTPAPTATPEVESIPNGGPIESAIELTGGYSEPGSGRVTVRVMYTDAGAPDEYGVNVIGSSGAEDSFQISATGNYDPSIRGITYAGINQIVGEASTVDTSGTLILDDSSGHMKMLWSDTSTGNTNRELEKTEGSW